MDKTEIKIMIYPKINGYSFLNINKQRFVIAKRSERH